MFGSAFGVGLGGCLGIIAAFIVTFFLIAFCAAAFSGGNGGEGAGNNDASQAVRSGSELALFHPSGSWPFLPGHPDAMKMRCHQGYFHTSGP